MNLLDTLRAIQDAQSQSRWADARELVYRAVCEEQKRLLTQRTPDATPGI